MPSKPRICCDPDDDWVIACTVVGRADAIVSGDTDLLALERASESPILSAAQLPSLLDQHRAR